MLILLSSKVSSKNIFLTYRIFQAIDADFLLSFLQSIKKIEKDTDRDYIMTPEEALEYGMIDKVVSMDKVQKSE